MNHSVDDPKHPLDNPTHQEIKHLMGGVDIYDLNSYLATCCTQMWSLKSKKENLEKMEDVVLATIKCNIKDDYRAKGVKITVDELKDRARIDERYIVHLEGIAAAGEEYAIWRGKYEAHVRDTDYVDKQMTFRRQRMNKESL